MEKTVLQKIGDESKKTWIDFWKVIEPFRKDLWKYCLKLTGSPWEAEDLLQDTMLKGYAGLSALSHRQQPLQPKPYLFRIATNHWLDQCRRKKPVPEEEMENQAEVNTAIDPIEVKEALEFLLQELTPRQTAVFILMESFRFTAKETAELLSASEGTIYSLLHRARRRLKHLQAAGIYHSGNVDYAASDTIKRFIDHYNQKDFKALAELLLDEASFSFVEMGSAEYGKQTITKYSLHPDKAKEQAGVSVFSCMLWGREALIFVRETEKGRELFDINTMEWEGDKIAHWQCYYFCEDFMQYAAQELKLLVREE